jgi:hypothetical protein
MLSKNVCYLCNMDINLKKDKYLKKTIIKKNNHKLQGYICQSCLEMNEEFVDTKSKVFRITSDIVALKNQLK